jgi:hypothetical protein
MGKVNPFRGFKGLFSERDLYKKFFHFLYFYESLDATTYRSFISENTIKHPIVCMGEYFWQLSQGKEYYTHI